MSKNFYIYIHDSDFKYITQNNESVLLLWKGYKILKVIKLVLKKCGAILNSGSFGPFYDTIMPFYTSIMHGSCFPDHP